MLRSLRGPLEFDPVEPTHVGLAYSRREKRRDTRPVADVYLPEGSGPHPGVLLVHGGGFILGSRAMKPVQRLTTALVGEGYAVASIDYRKFGRGGSRLRGIDDAHAALQWWFDQAPRFGVDRERIAAIGLSAGATLMLLASERPLPMRLRTRVSLFGLYDFESLDGPLGAAFRGLLLRGSDPRGVSPRRQLASDVPLVMLHGTADALVPVEQARELAVHRRAAGLPTELYELDDAPHGFFNQPGDHAQEGLRILLDELARALATSPSA